METKEEKKFDTVKFFRAEKERISLETDGMNYEELKKYLKDKQTLTKNSR